MEKIKLVGLEEIIYTDTCENGLKIYVWVNKKVNTFKGAYVVKCGFENISFQVLEEKIKVPVGTHHYLEHMMCKNDDNSSILGLFNKLGAYSNASTFGDKTVYEFVSSVNLKDNLELLLDNMYEKKFLEENFESERNPIKEEAKMQADNIARIRLYGINNCLFSKYPNRVVGLGTIEDIESITLEHINTIYDTFYHPKNSFVVVTGNVDPYEVVHIIKENQASKEYKEYACPELETYKEPRKVVEKEKTLYANVEMPRVNLSVKIPRSKWEDDEAVVLSNLNLVLNANFGGTSKFKEELQEQNLCVTLGCHAYTVRDYFIIQVASQTKYPEEVAPLLKEKLEKLELNEVDIKRKIKSEIANLVLGYEDPEEVCDMLIYMLVHYGYIIEREKEILENITMKKLKEIFKRVSMKEMNICYIKPKKDEN